MADIFPGAPVVEAGVGLGRAVACRCCVPSASQGTLHSFERREDFADIAQGNVRATSSAADHPAWTVTVGDLVESLPTRRRGRHRRPGRPRHARALGVPRRRRRRAHARRRAHLLRRHRHPAVPRRRGDPRPRRLHRAAGLGVAGARLAPRGPGGAARSTGCTGTPASSSPPGGWPRASPRRCASAARPRARYDDAATPTPGGQPGSRAASGRPRTWASGRLSEKKIRRVRRSVTELLLQDVPRAG